MKRQAYEILLKPLMTEKQLREQADVNRYYFKVPRDATKREIKKAVEDMFGVEVVKVNTMIMHGKTKRVGVRRIGRKPNWKKAAVTIREGQNIPLFEGI